MAPRCTLSLQTDTADTTARRGRYEEPLRGVVGA